MDQYRVGCTTNSCSTMHKLATTPITKECFSWDNMSDYDFMKKEPRFFGDIANNPNDDFDTIIKICESYRQKYLETKDNKYWRALIQILPSSWNQLRTWTGDYQILRAIYYRRKIHKLSEWPRFCNTIEALPYAKELICYYKE